MRKFRGPGLLLAALAFLPFIALADTGGAATAVLRVVGSPVVGEAGAYEGSCYPVLGPALPEAVLYQTVTLFHDADGDLLLDPGDMAAFTAELHNLLPEELGGLQLIFAFPSVLRPISYPPGARLEKVPPLSFLVVPLAGVGPYGEARIGFVAGIKEEMEAPALFVQAFLQGPGFATAADVPTTRVPLDPVTVAVREVAGWGGALFTSPGLFTKEVIGPPFVYPGEEREISLSLILPDGQGKIVVVDFLPPPLRLVPGSLSGNTEAIEMAGITMIRSRFDAIVPGERLSLRYRVALDRGAPIPFVASRAMAVLPSGDILFSDDPRTPEPDDPTALLLPWTDTGWSPKVWQEGLKRGSGLMPVLLRKEGGIEEIRWARFGPDVWKDASPGDLVFAGLGQVPPLILPQGNAFGLLADRSSVAGGKIYAPVEYGLPIFGEISGVLEEIGNLPMPPCGRIYLPILVEIPAGPPAWLTGVITDEGL